MAKTVDIARLKVFAVEGLPKDSKLRELILTEKDMLNVEEFLAKMDVWLKLVKMECAK